MFTAVGYSVLIRGFRLALTAEGLRPHNNNYVGDVERFAAECSQDSSHGTTPTDIREYILGIARAVRRQNGV